MLATDYGEHHFIKTNGVRLHYVSKGEGKLMLMLHGFPEFWYSWRHQITEFSPDYQVVAVDMRGYNESDKPPELEAYKMSELVADVKGIIEGLGYENCILVAHDWGGFVGWNLADAYPEMVEKLIILNVPHPALFVRGIKTTPQQIFKSWYAFLFQIPLLPEFILQLNDYSAIASMLRGTATNKNAFSESDLNAYKDAAAKRGALTATINYYRCGLKYVSEAEHKQWNTIDVPTLTIWGEDDVALCKELNDGTEKYAKNWQIKYIPNCNHWVQQEQPVLVNRYIREFINIF